MARKPAHLERAGALTPRDRMWAAMRLLAAGGTNVMGDPVGEFSPIEVAFLANVRSERQIHVDSVISYLRGLSRAEPPYVELATGRREMLRGEVRLYRLVRDVGVDAPRVNEQGKPVTEGIAADQMWAAMKALREFDRLELAAAASTPACAIQPDTARRYLHHLQRGGYVSVAAPCRRGAVSTRARYRFNRSMNTGPRAPIVCEDKSVLDANNGRVVFAPGKGGKGCQDQT